MEITSFKVILSETCFGDEFFEDGVVQNPHFTAMTSFRVESEINDTPVYGDSQVMTQKKQYHEKYGSLTLDQFMQRMRDLTAAYNAAEKITSATRMRICCAWVLKKIYESIDNSLHLIFDRIKKLAVTAYDQACFFNKQPIPTHKLIRKYYLMTQSAINKVCGKITDFLATRPDILFTLRKDSLRNFLEIATPEMVSKCGYLQQRRWIDREWIPLVSPKYYLFWNRFWKNLLISQFQTHPKIPCLSDDICANIAEFIPTKLEGSSFFEFFRANYDIKNDIYLNKLHLFTLTTHVSTNYASYHNHVTVFLK